MKGIPAKPFLKWVGGKARLIKQAGHLLPPIDTIRDYVEPFVGGGAFFFHMRAQGFRGHARISDTLEDLIATYTALKEEWSYVYNALAYFKNRHNAEYYYELRDLFNRKVLNPYSRAAVFIYLNCHCYNGLCRYNKKGGFNTPLHKISHMTRPLPSEDDLREARNALMNTTIACCDFRSMPYTPEAGDFVLLDPPYWPYHEGGFVGYKGDGFGEQDQRDVLAFFNDLTERGVRAMLWNADVPAVRDLYAAYSGTTHSFKVKCCVGRKCYDGKRLDRAELCVLNYSV